MLAPTPTSASALVDQVEFLRLDATRRLDPARRAKLGQFLTPPSVARLMASMFQSTPEVVRLLDPGAGVGSLTAAFVSRMLEGEERPKRIEVTAFELDPGLLPFLEQTLQLCRVTCAAAGVEFHSRILIADFIAWAADHIGSDALFADKPLSFDAVITNPPYRKINNDSSERRHLASIGIETVNLYTAFIAIACQLLHDSGELVAITPRSFANGPYYRPFRQQFLRTVRLHRLHVFDARDEAFSGDEVLQENVVYHAIKTGQSSPFVHVTSSHDAAEDCITEHRVSYDEVVRPGDPDQFIHLLTNGADVETARLVGQLTCTIGDLGLEVSTGRVVDFRARTHLRQEATADTVPLIYPQHFDDGFVQWPKPGGKKPNAIINDHATADLLVPSGHYVLTKRFSAKEESRRLVSVLFDPQRVESERVAFENHLNYFHRAGSGVPRDLAAGLVLFLNSTLADMFFRQFNGHTQVNATDLRNMRYPSGDQLVRLGRRVNGEFPDQDQLDAWVETELFGMTRRFSPTKARKTIEQAQTVLKSVGLPKAQTNARSAKTLLALLNHAPGAAWSEARNPLMGVRAILDFVRDEYREQIAENTRETYRRQTLHQFRDAGIVIQNPDDPTRAVNSPQTVYQVVPEVLELARTYGSDDWTGRLEAYLADVQTLRERYAQQRELARLPVRLPDGGQLELSPGGQNVLIKAVLEEFCPCFAPGGRVLYVGDAASKTACVDRERLASLNINFDVHGQFPDVVVHYLDSAKDIDWLLLIEACSSHGPMDVKRHEELSRLFRDASPGLVFVTAFADRRALAKYLPQIAWETEVWVAETPTHLIHFDGERFLGPYPSKSK